MEKNVTVELDKYPEGVFYPGFHIIDVETKQVNFKDNTDYQSSLVLFGNIRGTPIKTLKAIATHRK